jgi:acylphosphatase
MKLNFYVRGKVQKVGYRERVVKIARVLKLKGVVGNLDDGRVWIYAEGDEESMKFFERAIDIKDAVISVSSIEKDCHSAPEIKFDTFFKIVEEGETDSRLDTAADYLKELIGEVKNMNQNLGGKMDKMLQKQDDLLGEVVEIRKDLREHVDQRIGKVESDVVEIKSSLKIKGLN